MKEFILISVFSAAILFNLPSSLGEIKVEKVVNPVVHGEGPHWDSERGVLYYVDITGQTVNKYEPKTNSTKKVHIDGGPISFVVPDLFNDDEFVVGRGRDVVEIKWNGTSLEPSSLRILATVDEDKPENRFNDAKVDASGRLWAVLAFGWEEDFFSFRENVFYDRGHKKQRNYNRFIPMIPQGTMGPENPDLKPFQGSLYSFDWTDGFKPIRHVTPVSVSNGIAWNKNDSLMYYIDSPTRVIYVFDFDIVAGSLKNKRELFSLETNNIAGFPDGMTIDEEDNLWVAVFRGGCILHIDSSTGDLLARVEFPVSQVTSCAFGGDDLENLYVTTSKVSLEDEDLKKQPLAGSLFKVSGLSTRGQVKRNTIRTP